MCVYATCMQESKHGEDNTYIAFTTYRRSAPRSHIASIKRSRKKLVGCLCWGLPKYKKKDSEKRKEAEGLCVKFNGPKTELVFGGRSSKYRKSWDIQRNLF